QGQGYLLTLRGATLVAQKFDPGSLKLSGEPVPVADPVGDLAGVNQISAAVSGNGTLLYDPIGDLSQFTWLDRGGKRVPAAAEVGTYRTFRVSPDGHRVVTSRDHGEENDLRLLDVDRGVFSRFTTQPGLFPIWSPDGRAVVFSGGKGRSLMWKPLNDS